MILRESKILKKTMSLHINFCVHSKFAVLYGPDLNLWGYRKVRISNRHKKEYQNQTIMNSSQSIPLIIDRKYCGPPNSGNGGYVAGVLADLLPDTAVVTLRKPPPLDTRMDVYRSGDGLMLKHGEQLIAEASLSNLDLDIPAPPQL